MNKKQATNDVTLKIKIENFQSYRLAVETCDEIVKPSTVRATAIETSTGCRIGTLRNGRPRTRETRGDRRWKGNFFGARLRRWTRTRGRVWTTPLKGSARGWTKKSNIVTLSIERRKTSVFCFTAFPTCPVHALLQIDYKRRAHSQFIHQFAHCNNNSQWRYLQC